MHSDMLFANKQAARSKQSVPKVVASRVETSPDNAALRSKIEGSGIVAEVVDHHSGVTSEFQYNGGRHLLLAYEQSTGRHSNVCLDGRAFSAMPLDLPRWLGFVPAHHDYRETFRLRIRARSIRVYFDPLQFGAALSLTKPSLGFEDELLWGTIEKLTHAIQDADLGGSAYIESLGAVLAHEIAHHDREAFPQVNQRHGGLAPWQQSAVTAYIEEHLADQIPLAVLARLVRLSPHHFCRAFKQSLGLPPHRYHVARRVDRAKDLLEQTDMSITRIGVALGFGETSAFTAAFHRVAGMSPSRFRKCAPGPLQTAAEPRQDLSTH